VRRLRREAARGVALPWLIEWEGRLAGQLLITGIALGSARSGSAGYWVAREAAGRGVAPTALALAFDHAVGAAGLHRIEVAIRPDNRASLRVVAKLGFRDEGMRARYLHVGGRWADHRIFALTAEDVPEGLVARWRGSGGSCDSGVY
jgi:ribosomal-protein-alanine N-acetyltransferase